MGKGQKSCGVDERWCGCRTHGRTSSIEVASDAFCIADHVTGDITGDVTDTSISQTHAHMTSVCVCVFVVCVCVCVCVFSASVRSLVFGFLQTTRATRSTDFELRWHAEIALWEMCGGNFFTLHRESFS
jgi:hypothetical protein